MKSGACCDVHEKTSQWRSNEIVRVEWTREAPRVCKSVLGALQGFLEGSEVNDLDDGGPTILGIARTVASTIEISDQVAVPGGRNIEGVPSEIHSDTRLHLNTQVELHLDHGDVKVCSVILKGTARTILTCGLCAGRNVNGLSVLTLASEIQHQIPNQCRLERAIVHFQGDGTHTLTDAVDHASHVGLDHCSTLPCDLADHTRARLEHLSLSSGVLRALTTVRVAGVGGNLIGRLVILHKGLRSVSQYPHAIHERKRAGIQFTERNGKARHDTNTEPFRIRLAHHVIGIVIADVPVFVREDIGNGIEPSPEGIVLLLSMTLHLELNVTASWSVVVHVPIGARNVLNDTDSLNALDYL